MTRCSSVEVAEITLSADNHRNSDHASASKGNGGEHCQMKHCCFDHRHQCQNGDGENGVVDRGGAGYEVARYRIDPRDERALVVALDRSDCPGAPCMRRFRSAVPGGIQTGRTRGDFTAAAVPFVRRNAPAGISVSSLSHTSIRQVCVETELGRERIKAERDSSKLLTRPDTGSSNDTRGIFRNRTTTKRRGDCLDKPLSVLASEAAGHGPHISQEDVSLPFP